MDTVGQAHIVGTGRDQALVHPVMAEVALLGNILVIIIIDRIIGALVDAGPTPRAQLIIHHNNAVGSFADGLFRAGGGAGRVIAVPTQIDPE